jgi:hypothetical protein
MSDELWPTAGLHPRATEGMAMDFVIAVFTPDENAELNAMCHVAGVRLRLIKSFGDDEIAVMGPRGSRIYNFRRDLTPLTMDTMRAAIRHGLECIS